MGLKSVFDNMNDVMFDKYIRQNDVFVEGEFDFYQQGTVFSIGPRLIDADCPTLC